MTVAIIYERVLPDGTPTETTDLDYTCGFWCASDVAREKSLPGYVEEMTSRGMDGTWRSLDDDTGITWHRVYSVETDYEVRCASATCRDVIHEGFTTETLYMSEAAALAAHGLSADSDLSLIA